MELTRRENENYLSLLGDRPLPSLEISSKARMRWGIQHFSIIKGKCWGGEHLRPLQRLKADGEWPNLDRRNGQVQTSSLTLFSELISLVKS